jgi:hypothetical protein
MPWLRPNNETNNATQGGKISKIITKKEIAGENVQE